MVMMSTGMKLKKDEAQALARSCVSRPDFLPCDGSVCAAHSHGRCFRLHWCCCLGWCHCKYVYQPMTSVGQLPSTAIPTAPAFYTHTVDLTISLTRRFLQVAPCFRPPLYPESQRYCNIDELFIQDYIVKRINGKMCYIQRPRPSTETPPTPSPPSPPTQTQSTNSQRLDADTGQHSVDNLLKLDSNKPTGNFTTAKGPQMDHCSSPSSSEDSGINGESGNSLESCEEEDGLSEGSVWEEDPCALLSPSKSMLEIIENIETTV